jgi:hypothetical protein
MIIYTKYARYTPSTTARGEFCADATLVGHRSAAIALEEALTEIYGSPGKSLWLTP